jgi:lysozyme
VRIGEAGIALIKHWEGCRLSAYDDGGGVQTIGYGHIRGVKKGDRISQAEADELLLEDLETFENGVTLCLGDSKTAQHQFDAMTSLAFNIGIKAFGGSTVLKRHRLANYMGAANAFLLWHFDNHRSIPGLLRRREAERKLYLGDA